MFILHITNTIIPWYPALNIVRHCNRNWFAHRSGSSFWKEMNTGILCGLGLGLNLNELPNFNFLQWKNNSNIMPLQNKAVIPAYHLYLTKGLAHITRKCDHSIPSSKSHICQLLVVPSLAHKSTQETKSLPPQHHKFAPEKEYSNTSNFSLWIPFYIIK